MRHFFYIIFSFFTIYFYAQPISTAAIKVNNIYYKKNQIFFKPIHAQLYKNISKTKNENFINNIKNESYIAISVNTETYFIYKKDTMKIKLFFDIYSYYRISIKKMNFQKGEYIIDLKKCIENKGFIIENFPYDCIIYRKEE